ncbi:MAG: pyridoxamine 5'-phosphate oxidase family protein [Chloroflexi bacterium]|nr:MAG: pyridoxamine 5'-phosphate oxidase family protein [Chloroflexota bacterium]
MTVERRSRRFSSLQLQRVARRLMDASPLCSLATVSPRGRAHINHMYFAWNQLFEVFWISDADSIHSRNLARNPSAAVTVYASNQVWGRPDRGIQLFGTAGVTRSAEPYARRFKEFDAEGNDLPCYRFRPRTLKLFDERSLAGGTLVTARVTRTGLEWMKTEVWT